MRIVVPYANDVSDPCVHDVVKLNLALLQIDAEWVRMREPNDYALLVNRLWDEGEKFLLLEHDVVVWRGAAEAVWECPEPVCGYDGTLCCTKIEPAELGSCPVPPSTSWTMVDSRLFRGLWDRGVGFHEHSLDRAPVVNLNREAVPASGVVRTIAAVSQPPTPLRSVAPKGAACLSTHPPR